jgi:DNA-binding MarR family transcriptional regulator
MKPIPKAAPPDMLALELYLPFRLSVLSNRMTRAVARVYARKFRLMAPEWRTMAVLGRYGAMAANTVAERTAMDKVRVSRSVARLLKLGHITRRTDPVDRRRALLDLTPAGAMVYRQVVPLVLAVEADLLAGFTPEEVAALRSAIARLEARVAVHSSAAED